MVRLVGLAGYLNRWSVVWGLNPLLGQLGSSARLILYMNSLRYELYKFYAWGGDGILDMYRLKSTGDTTPSLGTPRRIFRVLDCAPLNSTYVWRPLRYRENF